MKLLAPSHYTEYKINKRGNFAYLRPENLIHGSTYNNLIKFKILKISIHNFLLQPFNIFQHNYYLSKTCSRNSEGKNLKTLNFQSEYLYFTL